MSLTLVALIDQGKARGHVLEQDIEALFDDRSDSPDETELDAARQTLLNAGVMVLADEGELEEVEQRWPTKPRAKPSAFLTPACEDLCARRQRELSAPPQAQHRGGTSSTARNDVTTSTCAALVPSSWIHDLGAGLAAITLHDGRGVEVHDCHLASGGSLLLNRSCERAIRQVGCHSFPQLVNGEPWLPVAVEHLAEWPRPFSKPLLQPLTTSLDSSNSACYYAYVTAVPTASAVEEPHSGPS